MAKSTQMKLFPKQKYNLTTHGGENSVGKRKTARPLDRRKTLHIVMRASKARGEFFMRLKKHNAAVERIVKRQATKNAVKIQQFANVGYHLHLSVRFSITPLLKNFLRTTAAMIARAVTGACRGKPFGKFWDYLAFTRVIRTWTEEKNLRRYLEANQIEAIEGKFAREWFLAGFS